MSEHPRPVQLAFDLPGCRAIVESPDPPVTHANIPFAGVVDTMLPLLEQRTHSPISSCKHCQAIWSTALSARLSHPATWMNCPNGCDDGRLEARQQPVRLREHQQSPLGMAAAEAATSFVEGENQCRK